MNFGPTTIALIMFLNVGILHARQVDSLLIVPTDSLFFASNDSLTADSTAADTIAAKKKSDLEGPIRYWCDSVFVSRTGNKIYLFGNAKITYQNMTLEAAKITIDQDDHYLFAEGIIDTIDTAGNPVYKGIPIFTETGQEAIYGDSLYFDIKTKRGRIANGKTQMPPGYYKGIAIHKISDKTLLVKDGYFTSCEYIDDPHFYFRSADMRVVMNDKIIARPVYLYIADVPLLAIPFGVFPNKRGRRSGLVVPTYGENDYGGRFLRDIGYYWAPNDYFDALLTTDFYDKIGFTYSTRLNYALRYVLNGNFSGYYLPRDPNTGMENHRWAVSLNHSQTIDPTLRFSASGRFQSDKTLARDLSPDINVRTNQNLYSSFNLSKSWPGTRNSLSLSASRNENLQTGNWDYTLPNLRFTRQQTALWETFTGRKSRGKKEWYQGIMFSYNSDLLHKGSKNLQTADSTFKYETEQGVQHSLGFNAPIKVLKYFNLSPNLNYREVWVDEIYLAQPNTQTGVTEKTKVRQFAARRTFNTGASMRTTLYGMFEPKIGSLKSIRHKIDPSISYTFTPDFSDPSYGYVTSYIDTLGNKQKVDKFATSPYGGTPTSKSQRMGISVNNLFQAKVGNDEEERKIDLFTVNFNTSHDFNRDSLKWSDLATSFRATPVSGVNMTMNTSHSFYEIKNNRPVNNFLLTSGKLPLLLSFNAGLSFALNSKMFVKEEDQEKKKIEGESTEEEFSDTGMMNPSMIQQEKESDRYAAKNLDMNWNASFNLNYRYSRTGKSKSFDLGPNAGIQLTRNWKVSWTGRFDLVDFDITYQSFSIYRNLHCWEMSFSWQPSYGYYQFQINVKASELKDLKLDKKPTRRSYY
jgi:lipopolysaccharide export system protein LptA